MWVCSGYGMTDHVLTITEGGQRLDRALVEQLPELSRTQIQRLISAGRVTVDGQQPAKAGLKLAGGERVVVHVPAPAPSDLKPEAIPLDIVYEDADLLVINKASGMVVHPSPGHTTGTLINAVLAHAPDIEGVGGEQRPGLVHRLDKDTSGLIVVAKNDRTPQFLQAQFKARTVRKVYDALVVGHLPTPTGRIEAPIGRDPRHRKRMAVTTLSRGREAITEYHTRATFKHYTYVAAKPKTGRTHQIRVHFQFMGCPIAGDVLYASHSMKRDKLASDPGVLARLFLHAGKLKLQLPDNTEKMFECPLPDDLQTVLDSLA